MLPQGCHWVNRTKCWGKKRNRKALVAEGTAILAFPLIFAPDLKCVLAKWWVHRKANRCRVDSNSCIPSSPARRQKIWVSRHLTSWKFWHLSSWSKKTYINGFRRVVVVVVGWGVQNSRTFFCEYTLRRRWVVFGNRLKGWRCWPVYRSALPPQSSASWAVAGVPRFKAWSRAACLASRSSQDKTRLGPTYDNHSFE